MNLPPFRTGHNTSRSGQVEVDSTWVNTPIKRRILCTKKDLKGEIVYYCWLVVHWKRALKLFHQLLGGQGHRRVSCSWGGQHSHAWGWWTFAERAAWTPPVCRCLGDEQGLHQSVSLAHMPPGGNLPVGFKWIWWYLPSLQGRGWKLSNSHPWSSSPPSFWPSKDLTCTHLL